MRCCHAHASASPFAASVLLSVTGIVVSALWSNVPRDAWDGSSRYAGDDEEYGRRWRDGGPSGLDGRAGRWRRTETMKPLSLFPFHIGSGQNSQTSDSDERASYGREQCISW